MRLLHWHPAGDYQTGEYDTDAAENVAYDKNTKRAFLASAESGTVQVVDISSPRDLVETGTLNVGAIMAAQCTDVDCDYEDMDFGGGSAPCGYAPMKNIIFEKGDCSACAETGTCAASDCPYTRNPGYNAGKLAVDASVGTAAGCRAACQADPGCAHFSWENELWTAGNQATFGTAGETVRVARCFLKGTYGQQNRDGETITPEKCNADAYVHWEAHKSQSTRGEAWAGMAPDYPYGFAPGKHYTHVYDGEWMGLSGPKYCQKFQAESVQSVAVTHVPGYPNAIVATASPHKFDFAKGMLAFFDAKTFEFLACGPAGNKPEGIASDFNGKISCINEGSAMSLEDTPIDVEGSMTMCTATAASGAFSVSCETKDLAKANFKDGKWKHAVEYRVDGVRLYGPNANNVTYDLEPEGGAFTEDGLYQLVVMQDNDAYAMYDVAAGKFLFMGGFSSMATESTLDGSDKDDKINIHDVSPSKPLTMPDQVTSFTHDGEYYFITSNEGGSRDDGDGLIGKSGDWEGEEIRMSDIPGCTGPLCEKAELGRVLTTGYMPSDYAINACGNNMCGADGLDAGGDGDDGPVRTGVKGAGAFKCIYKNADYGGCGSVCNLHDNHYEWADPSGCSNYPTTLAHYVHSDADNEYYGPGCTANNCDKGGWRYASWAQKNGVKPELAESATSLSPLGYDSAVACQQLCKDEPGCDHWCAVACLTV